MPASAGAIRAGRAFVELFADDTKLVRGLKLAQQRLQTFGSQISGVGRQMLGAGASLLTPLLGASVVFSQMGDELDKLSTRTGFTVEQLSGLKHAAGLSDASMEDLEAGLRGMEKSITKGGKAFQALGIDLDQLRKQSPAEQFGSIADAIAAVRDPTQRAALAMQVLGKGGTALLPMLAGGRKGLNEMAAEAERLGLIMTTAESKSAAAYNDALGTLWEQLKMTAAVIGSAVAPLLTDLLKRSQPIIAATITWVRANRPLLANLFAIAAAVAGLGATLIGGGVALQGLAWSITPALKGLRLFAGALQLAWSWGGKLIRLLGAPVLAVAKTIVSAVAQVSSALLTMLVKGVTAGVAGLGGALGVLLTPLGLIGTAIVGIAGYALYASGMLQGLWEVGAEALSGLMQTAITAWGAIGEALARGDITAAAQVLWAGLVLEWTRGVGLLENWWAKGTTFFKNVWDTAATRLAKGFIDVVATLQTAWQGFVNVAEQLWSRMVSGVIQGAFSVAEGIYAVEEMFGADRSGQRMMLKFARAGFEAAGNAERAGLASGGDARLAEIERQRQQQQRIVDADLERRMGARDAQVASTLAENLAALEAAQTDFTTAVEAARNSAADAPAGATLPTFDPESELLSTKNQRSGTQGTFSALADRMFAFGGSADPAERTAKAAESTEAHLASIRTRGVPVQITYSA